MNNLRVLCRRPPVQAYCGDDTASHVDAIAFVSALWFGVAAVAAAETPVAIGLWANGGNPGRDRALGQRRRIRAERDGSEGPAPAPGRIQSGQFLVFTL